MHGWETWEETFNFISNLRNANGTIFDHQKHTCIYTPLCVLTLRSTCKGVEKLGILTSH